jgi:hypothetical protein
MFTYHEKVSCSTKEPLKASWVIGNKENLSQDISHDLLQEIHDLDNHWAQDHD